MLAQVTGGVVIWLSYPKLHPRAKIELSSLLIFVNRRYATGSCPMQRAPNRRLKSRLSGTSRSIYSFSLAAFTRQSFTSQDFSLFLTSAAYIQTKLPWNALMLQLSTLVPSEAELHTKQPSKEPKSSTSNSSNWDTSATHRIIRHV